MSPKKDEKTFKAGKKKITIRRTSNDIQNDQELSVNTGGKKVVRKRRKKDKNKKKFSIFKYLTDKTVPLYKRIIFGIILFILACILLGIGVGIFWMVTAPPLDLAKLEFATTSHILDSEGEFYQELQAEENRKPLNIDEIPIPVQMAFVAIEDKRFYEHNGVDLIGTGKAIFGVFTSGSIDGPGGSTITQQLIKLTHLTSQTAISRKVMEWKLAVELEMEYSKEEILEAYLNKVNMSQAWGIEGGANYFFGKSTSELSIAQAAVLASIINAPTYYNPIKYEEDGNGGYKIAREINADGDEVIVYDEPNKERSLTIIAEMYAQGHISEREYEVAKSDLTNNKIGLKTPKDAGIYSYFTDAVYTEVVNDIMAEYNYTQEEASAFVLNSNLTIKSTVDADVQNAMEENAENDSLFPSQSSSARSASAAMTEVKGEEVEYNPEVGMAIIENDTGHVVGLLGGRDKQGSLSMNRALQKFQPGSSTKPLTTYGPGIDSGKITMGTTFDNTKILIGSWSPQNSGGGYSGMTTCRSGLTKSTNTIAVQAYMATGADTVLPYAQKLGLDIITEGAVNDLNPAAFALGGYSVGQSPLAMASAYTTFPNEGVRMTPILYTEVVDKNGEVILSTESEAIQVFDAGTAYIITDVLKDVVKGGTTTISIPNAEIAGKTGTTDSLMHAWFCGYTAEYSGAVWYGYDQNKVTANGRTYTLNVGVFGGSYNGPAEFFEQTFRQIYEDKNIDGESFPAKPSNVFSASVDGVSGKSPTELSSQDPRGSKIYSELFLEGFGPAGEDDMHVLVPICSASGERASDYCPHSLVSEEVMLNLTDERFPEGVKDGSPDSSPGGQEALRAPAEDEMCSVHDANTSSSLAFYQGTSSVSSVSIDQGDSITLSIKGVSQNGLQSLSSVSFSSSNSSVIRVSKTASDTVVITGLTGGSATLTATSTMTSSSGGSYKVTSSIPIQVEGSSYSNPTFNLSYNGSNVSSVTINQGDSFNEPTVQAYDYDNSNISNLISKTIVGPRGTVPVVDTSVVGSYEITYFVQSPISNLSNTKTFTVRVQ